MSYYTIHEKQTLPIQVEEAWEFFSQPENLGKLTPPEMHFKILHKTGASIFQGQLIIYKINIAKWFSMKWVTEITHVQNGSYFVDEQRFGPYKFWHHLHKFKPSNEGVVIEDEVCYKIPFGFVGKIAHKLFVKKMLHRIFKYRFAKLKLLYQS